jgi:hypothetical protein
MYYNRWRTVNQATYYSHTHFVHNHMNLIVWSHSLKKEKTKRYCIEVCHRIIYQEEITFDLLIWQDALKEILWYLYCYDVDLSDKYQEIYVKYQRFIFFLCDIIVFINDFCALRCNISWFSPFLMNEIKQLPSSLTITH